MADGPLTVVAYEIERGIQPNAPNGEQRQLVPMPDAAPTAIVQRVIGKPFEKGNSGNPAGRKPGSRNRISELFISAMRDDFAQRGADAIAALRERDPATYLAAIRGMIPAHTMVENADKLPTVNDAEWSDAEFAAMIDGGGNPLEQAARQARRNKAFDLFSSGKLPTMRAAMIAVGATLP